MVRSWTTTRGACDRGSKACSPRAPADSSSWKATSASRPWCDEPPKASTSVIHLAYINGTEFFYSKPDLVLEVAVKGMMNVLDACRADRRPRPGARVELRGLPDAAPRSRPTRARRCRCPMCSTRATPTAAGRSSASCWPSTTAASISIASTIFRPHNCYGPDMGHEHVIPQLANRLAEALRERARRPVDLARSREPATRHARSSTSTIWSTASLRIIERGEHLEIYHVGTDEEVTIARSWSRRWAAASDAKFGRSRAGCSRAAPCAAAPTSPSCRRSATRRASRSTQGLSRQCLGTSNPKRTHPMNQAKEVGRRHGGSVVVERCQVCGSTDLEPVFFVGYLPPVNGMPHVGEPPARAAGLSGPGAQLPPMQARCSSGSSSIPAILFPPTYPYTSGTTKILRDNFAELYREVSRLYPLAPTDLGVDIGSNDGTLLSNFHNRRPPRPRHRADQRGQARQRARHPHLISFFNRDAVEQVVPPKRAARRS